MPRSPWVGLLEALCCCAPRRDRFGDHDRQPLAAVHRAAADHEALLARSAAARARLLAELGEPAPFALDGGDAAGAGGALVGAPRWPAGRAAFRLVRRPDGAALLATDGLSDPFDDIAGEAAAGGYGLEFYVVAPAGEAGATAAEARAGWPLALLRTVAALAAGHGGIAAIVDDLGLLSTEAEGVSEALPERARGAHVNRAGRVGALLGLGDGAPPGAPGRVPAVIEGMPADVRFVNVKLLALSELRLITERGAEGRQKLAELFGPGPGRLASSVDRAPAL